MWIYEFMLFVMIDDPLSATVSRVCVYSDYNDLLIPWISSYI